MHSLWFRSTFLRLFKFLQIKEAGPNFLGESILQKAELFGPPFWISILKLSTTQMLHHSLDFNAFSMFQEYFSQNFKISKN